jgi:hypothetical protein
VRYQPRRAVTLEWVHWYNTERTHQAIDGLSPEAAEQLHYRFKATPRTSRMTYKTESPEIPGEAPVLTGCR